MVPNVKITKRQFNEIIRNEIREKACWELSEALRCYSKDDEVHQSMIEVLLRDLWRKSPN